MASLIMNCHELLGLSWGNLCFIISILPYLYVSVIFGSLSIKTKHTNLPIYGKGRYHL